MQSPAATAGGVPIAANQPCVVCGATSRRGFMRHEAFEVVACGGCGLRLLDPMPSTESASALYSDDYFRNDSALGRGYDDYEAERDNMRATFRDRLRHLPVPSDNARLLDVGAAAGFFVEQARLAGWDAEGLELNAWAAEYAREKLGVPVRSGSLDDAGYPDRSFAAVTMWEVIEHIPQPRELIREIARILQPGGLLALSTPDAGSAVARLFGRRWLGWKKIPEHVYFFDRGTLGRLLREEGFAVISTRYVSLTVRASYALDRLAALVGIPWLTRVPKAVGDASIRVNPLYDLMVVARVRE